MAVQFLLLPFYLWLLYSICTIRLSKRYKDAELQRLYKIGLLLKFFGGFAFFAIYKYYYIYGDTFGYYNSGNLLAGMFRTDPAGFFKFLFSGASNYDGFTNSNHVWYIYRWGKFFKDADSWLMLKMSALTNLVTFNSYLFSTFIFSTLSFFGLWKMFIVFYRRYSHLKNQLFIAVFGVPSILFWGSGLLKDTVTIACLGFAFYQFDAILYRGKFKLRSITILVLSALMILTLKGYVLLAFVPPLLLSLYFYYLSKINGVFLKSITAVFLLIGMAFGGIILLQYFASVSQEFELDRLTTVAETFHDSHGRLNETGQAGSGYSLSITSYTIAGMLKVFPQAVNVTLFRPYLWEVRSPIMLLSAVESMVIGFFTLKVVFKARLFGFFSKALEPFALMSILYAVILGFAIGITAFNFGALVRFKIPLVPFFIIGLLIINDNVNKSRKAKKERKENIRNERMVGLEREVDDLDELLPAE